MYSLGNPSPPTLNASCNRGFQFNVDIDSSIEMKKPNYSGSEPLEIHWLHCGTAIEDDDSILVTENFNLLISKIQFRHSGQYLCVIANKYGQIRVPYFITISENGEY